MPFIGSAQDMILLKDKSTISVRVIQEDKESVTYILQDNSNRLIKQIEGSKVKKVKYERIPKSVNVIIIQHDSLSNELLLNDLIGHLIVSGYTIEEFDNDYYTVSTPWKSNKRLNAQIVENEAFFRCFHREGDDAIYPHATAKVTFGIEPKPDEKRGAAGSTAFKDLDEFCRTYLKNGEATLRYYSEYIE
jgi:hypothetical protein